MNNWMDVLPWAFSGVALLALALQSIILRRRLADLEHRMNQRGEDLGRDLHALSGSSMGMGRRLMETEKRLQQMQTTLEEMRQNDPLRISYDEASRLVELGADVEDLMNSCGISRPEAELVSALRRGKKIVA